MAEDFEELRRFLREEGVSDGLPLQAAERDPLLAEAGHRALDRILDRRPRRAGRRLVGVAAALGIGLAAGSVLLGGEFYSPATRTPPIAAPAVSPLGFTPQPGAADMSLASLAEAADREVGYSGSGPEPRAWYTWDASTPQQGELFVLAPRGDRDQLESFLVPPPQGGQIDLSVRRPARLDALDGLAIPGGGVADVLAAAAGEDCSSGDAGCAIEGLAALRASTNPGAVVSDAAAWRVLRTLPGVESLGSTTDRLGRPALGFAAEGADPRQRIQVLVDPATGGFLGAEWATEQGQVTRILVAARGAI